jgi:hypothetical protein
VNDYCPECETDLDRQTGICPACRWDPLLTPNVRTIQTTRPADMSLTERYRGTPYDFSMPIEMTTGNAGVSRGRTFVIVGLVGAASLYGVLFAVMSGSL